MNILPFDTERKKSELERFRYMRFNHYDEIVFKNQGDVLPLYE